MEGVRCAVATGTGRSAEGLSHKKTYVLSGKRNGITGWMIALLKPMLLLIARTVGQKRLTRQIIARYAVNHLHQKIWKTESAKSVWKKKTAPSSQLGTVR